VHLAEWRSREQEVTRTSAREQSSLHGEDAGRGAHLVCAEVQRRTDEDVPEKVDACLGLAKPTEQRAERLVVVLSGIELRELARDAADSQPLAEAEVPVAEQPHEPWPNGLHAPILGNDREAEPNAPERPRLPDLGDEIEVRGAASEGNVLAIVGRRARIPLPLGECLNRAAERRPCLEQAHAMTLSRELERCRQAREPPADDRDPHSATTARIFSTVER
jgi:hypothetical protein